MANIRLIPSTYQLSNTSYLNISNASNMYHNIDNTTYAQVNHTRSSSTTQYYIYVRGFNFSDIPSNATVTSAIVKVKAQTQSDSSRTPALYNNTTSLSKNLSLAIGTSITTSTVDITSNWTTYKNYGNNFGIRLGLGRQSRNTASNLKIYGAEIEVTYTVPEPVTITSSLIGNGTISPNGATSLEKGDEYILTIVPANASDTVTATKNGVDITNQLVRSTSGTKTEVLGSYTLVSGGFNGSGASYFQGLVGKGESASETSSNYYSSGSGTNAVFTYDVGMEIPAGATITQLYMKVSGHPESTSNSSEYMCVQFKSGSTYFSDKYNFKDSGSTSNTTQTVNATTIPSISQMEDLKIECTLGYYGGALNGATVYCVYTISGTEYVYTYTTDGNATIVVTIQGAGYKTCVITYDGRTIATSQETSAINITYNGSIIASNVTVTKTLKCNGKVMVSDVVIGGKTLKCNGKIMASDVVVSVS